MGDRIVNKLLAGIDAAMLKEYGACRFHRYGGEKESVAVYQSTEYSPDSQRFLVEIRDGKWSIYTFHQSGKS